MSSPDRRTFLALLAVAPLAGCGFAPAFGTGGAAGALPGAIRADDPTDKNGFDFVQRMEERLGRPTSPAYDLHYTITTKAIGVGITPEGAITRYNLTGGIDWALERRADKARMVGGHVESFTSYSATGSTVAGLAAEEDAALRLMRILADQIVLRLVAEASTFLQ